MSAWIHATLKSSCAKLLAAKLSLVSQRKVFEKFGSDLKGDDRIGFAEAEYKINPRGFLSKDVDIIQTLFTQSISASLKELVCSSCSDYRVEMHHVRIKDLKPKLRKIDQLMVKKRRKQIPLCRTCHLTYKGPPRLPNRISLSRKETN